MRFASLGSGSEGNGLLVEWGETRVLLDCGFSLSDTERRLARLGLVPQALSAILATHEHSDHLSGVAPLARRYGLPVFGSFGTLSLLRDALDAAQLRPVADARPFTLGGLDIEPFAVPHDAREPLQFVLGNGRLRLGVLTDTGCATPHIEQMLRTCDALFLETNYDPRMLAQGPYPPQLKARVRGRFGHLSNGEAAELLSRLEHRRLQRVVAAHVSQKNNTPELARAALSAVLGWAPDAVAVADQDEGLDWQVLQA
ncbi:MAG: MBL fold metallo-hydrolase [Betaproteobacteria bacterium]|nr:MBL fold metallo-hydrolase [Betaproteobacteria bacterium]MDE2354566.1 MBL fold metallo-hydrolase [Betaproteobacteria bacterium]